MNAIPTMPNQTSAYQDYERYLLSLDEFTKSDIDQLRQLIARTKALGESINEKFVSYYASNAESRALRADFDLMQTPRRGWVERMSQNAGNVLHHSRALARFIAEYDDEDMPNDRSHMMALAEVHDKAEAIVSDLTPKIKEKYAITSKLKRLIEDMAIAIIYESPALQKEKDLIKEYEAKETNAAEMVSDIDKCFAILEAAHQFINPNVKRKRPLSEEIYDSVSDGRLIRTPLGNRLLAKIRTELDTLNAAQHEERPPTPVIDLFLNSQKIREIHR